MLCKTRKCSKHKITKEKQDRDLESTTDSQAALEISYGLEQDLENVERDEYLHNLFFLPYPNHYSN